MDQAISLVYNGFNEDLGFARCLNKQVKASYEESKITVKLSVGFREAVYPEVIPSVCVKDSPTVSNSRVLLVYGPQCLYSLKQLCSVTI